ERLELLTQKPDANNLTSKLEEQRDGAWQAFNEGVSRLVHYLAKFHPEEYQAIMEEDEALRQQATQEADFNVGRKAPTGTLARKYGKRLDAAVKKVSDENTT